MAVTVDGALLPLAGCGESVRVNGEEVAGVLVGPSDRQAADLDDPTAPAGARIDYRLDFPKSYVADLTGAVVEVRGDLVRVIGKPVRYADGLCPGQWNCSAYATAAPGDMTAQARVMAVSAVVDDRGDPVKVALVAYDGPAQARMTGGSVAPGDGVEAASEETWHFVVPWTGAIAALRPEACYVECAGARYDAAYILDVDGAHAWADIEAVRHG